MQGFMDELYFYVLEKAAPCYLQTTEYRKAAVDVEEEWKAFQSMLTAEQREQMEMLLEKRAKITRLEDEAVFSCALSIGIELGRL